jgi:AraC-like DNA-binding protein
MNQYTDLSKIHLKSTDRLNLKRSIYSINVIIEYAKKFNITDEVLLYGSTINSSDLADPEMFTTPEKELKIFKRAISLIPDPKIGLEIGRLHNVSAMTRVAIPAMFCDTALDAFHMMFKYIELTQTYCKYELTVKGDFAILSFEELIVFGDLRRFLCERDLVSAYTLCCNIMGSPLILKEITVTYPQPEYSAVYQEIFNCPVTFNADRYQVIFDKSYLSNRLPLANALTRDTYEKECKRAYARLHEQKSTLDKMQQELLFPHGEPPCFDKLARRLNMSTRTLRRHLSAEGISYKAFINDIRKNRALELITSTNMSIETIATELGYKDVANFYHAFKHWTGTTPSNYRKTKVLAE